MTGCIASPVRGEGTPKTLEGRRPAPETLGRRPDRGCAGPVLATRARGAGRTGSVAPTPCCKVMELCNALPTLHDLADAGSEGAT
jgi:hypothetical protein